MNRTATLVLDGANIFVLLISSFTALCVVQSRRTSSMPLIARLDSNKTTSSLKKRYLRHRVLATSTLFLVFLFCLFQPASAQFATTAVYIGNQGNFSDANGSISIYNPDSGDLTTDGIPNLNTLIQSITLHGDTGYVMANTSNRIDVFDAATNTRISQILGIASPRYMTVIDDTKAYVSNLFDNTITVLNLIDNCPEFTVPVGSNPEDIAVSSGRAYVANNGFGADSTLTVIDVSTDEVIDTIDLECDGPRMLEVDGQGDVWVFCNGNTVYNDDFTEIIEQTNGQVLVLGGHSGAVLARFELDAQIGAASAGQDAFYDAITDRAFVVQGSSVLVFNTTTNTQLESIEISGDEPIGGVAYDADGDRLYLARITGFTTAGFVSVHDLSGMEVDRFDAGIAPTTIALKQVGTSVSVEEETPAQDFTLQQNYPNPFSTTTTISFEIPEPGHVSLNVYNVLGEQVASLVNEMRPAGLHEASWNPENLPSGTYFYRLEAGDASTSKRLLLVR